MILENCTDCIYNKNCPCGYSLHNAACLTISKPKMAYGRYWALQNNKCPRVEFNSFCADCPDSCPLHVSEEIVNGHVVGRNNIDNHPEDFINEYENLYNDEDYKLGYSVNGKPTYGYYFEKEPKYWNDFKAKVAKAIMEMKK